MSLSADYLIASVDAINRLWRVINELYDKIVTSWPINSFN